MAITVVRQTSDNRVVAAFAESDDATTYSTASGSGHDTVTLSDAQQGTETANSLMGKVVSNAGVVSAYNRAGNALRDYRREQCYQLIEEALGSVPPVAAESDADASGIIHKYLRMCYAAAATNANMTNAARFGEVEAACKGGDLAKGMPDFFRRLVTDSTVSSAWSTALGDATVLQSPNAAGGVVAKTAGLPSDWATNAAYHAVRVIGR